MQGPRRRFLGIRTVIAKDLTSILKFIPIASLVETTKRAGRDVVVYLFLVLHVLFILILLVLLLALPLVLVGMFAVFDLVLKAILIVKGSKPKSKWSCQKMFFDRVRVQCFRFVRELWNVGVLKIYASETIERMVEILLCNILWKATFLHLKPKETQILFGIPPVRIAYLHGGLA